MKLLPESLKRLKTDYLLLGILAFSIDLWAFSLLDLRTFQYVHLLILCYFFYVTFSFHRKIPDCFHKISVILLMLIPLCSIFTCYKYHNQAIGLSVINYRMHLGWLIYFVLWYKRISPQKLLKVIFIIAIVYSVITLLQQLTYPAFAPFGGRTIGTSYAENFSGEVEKRMGLYRFSVGGYQYCMMAFLLLYGLFQVRFNKRNLLIYACFLLGIIAIGSRTTLLAFVLAFSILYLWKKGSKRKFLKLFLLAMAAYFVIAFADQIFGKLANVQGDLEEGRLESYLYYSQQLLKDNMCLIFGNGLPHADSYYGYYTGWLNQTYHIIWSDIGFLGTAYNWGLLYVGFYIFTVLRFVMDKRLDISYKAVLLLPLFICWVQSPLWEFGGFLYQGVLFYLCDMNILSNKKA